MLRSTYIASLVSSFLYFPVVHQHLQFRFFNTRVEILFCKCALTTRIRWDRSVSIMTRTRARRLRGRNSTPGWGKFFSFLSNVSRRILETTQPPVWWVTLEVLPEADVKNYGLVGGDTGLFICLFVYIGITFLSKNAQLYIRNLRGFRAYWYFRWSRFCHL